MGFDGPNSRAKSSQRNMSESIERVVASGLAGAGVTSEDDWLVSPEATETASVPSAVGSRLVGWGWTGVTAADIRRSSWLKAEVSAGVWRGVWKSPGSVARALVRDRVREAIDPPAV